MEFEVRDASGNVMALTKDIATARVVALHWGYLSSIRQNTAADVWVEVEVVEIQGAGTRIVASPLK